MMLAKILNKNIFCLLHSLNYRIFHKKPFKSRSFNSREVVARVKAVLRRANTQEKKGDASRITYDGLIVDMEEYQVTAFGHKMTFTTKEMELLWCLASLVAHTTGEPFSLSP